MLLPLVVIVLTSTSTRRVHSGSFVVSYIVLIALALVGRLAVLFSGGFGFPPFQGVGPIATVTMRRARLRWNTTPER